jgi:murein DD-endopeptidase MepM/ murein hydrolase activator NlpD
VAQEVQNSDKTLKMSLSNGSKLYHGNAGILRLEFPAETLIEEKQLSGEMSLNQTDGSLKTILFPFYQVSPTIFEAVIGIPYRSVLGEAEIKVLVSTETDSEEYIHPFKILKYAYGQDKPLTVDPNTVKPDAATQLIIDNEQKILDEIYATAVDQKMWTVPFKVPVDTPYITSNYGNARVYNGTLASYHSGMDYRGNEQTPLKSMNDGVVRLTRHLHYTGNTVIIDHGKGLFTIYGHMSKFAKDLKPGVFVKKGQYIGQAGRTGRVTGPHLHLGLKIHGELVNPTFLYTIK